VRHYQTPRVPPRPVDRAELIRRARAHLEAHSYSRLELSLVVALSGVCGFLVSYGLLAGGVVSMPLRYGAAGLASYLAFLALIRVWLAWKSGVESAIDAADVMDGVDFVPRLPGDATSPSFFAGGRSGGGGASGSWMEGGTAPDSGGSSSWSDAWDGDLGWILVFAAALLAGLATIGYVVYLAPLLLAEALVDGVIVATIAHRVSDLERRDWTATVVRRTWLPALAVIGLLMIGGFALQKLAPDARSIGPAIAQILD
jgi:hypothetical protein